MVPAGCRKPEPETDWLLYHAACPPLGADFPAVFLLLEDEAECFWADMVDDADRRYFSYRKLPPDHRLARASAFGPNWYTYANDPGLPDRVAEFLRASLPWPGEQVVFYTHAPRYTFRLPWAVFLGHWRRFMMLDESFVFGQGRPEFALFADAGGLSVGDTRLDAEPKAPRDQGRHADFSGGNAHSGGHGK